MKIAADLEPLVNQFWEAALAGDIQGLEELLQHPRVKHCPNPKEGVHEQHDDELSSDSDEYEEDPDALVTHTTLCLISSYA